jgi:hypothetical protein
MYPCTDRFRAVGPTTASGRVKPATFDLAMAGDGSTAAVGVAQIYTRTRPTPAERSIRNQTFAGRFIFGRS